MMRLMLLKKLMKEVKALIKIWSFRLLEYVFELILLVLVLSKCNALFSVFSLLMVAAYNLQSIRRDQEIGVISKFDIAIRVCFISLYLVSLATALNQ